jgi:hypothetical protein
MNSTAEYRKGKSEDGELEQTRGKNWSGRSEEQQQVVLYQ